MLFKKNLYLFAPVLLLSNGLIQGMDVKITVEFESGLDKRISYDRKLKEYDAFVEALKHEKYEIIDDRGVKSLNGLVELAVEHSDIRYLEKLMEYKEYANYIRATGLSIYQAWVNNRHVKRIKFLLDAGADINKVIRGEPYETLLWLAVRKECGVRMAYNDRSDKVIELLIKRGANVAIKFDEKHPTLLDAAEKWEHEKYRNRSNLVNLLINASQIRAAYLNKQAFKREQKQLENFKADQVLNMKDKSFKLHTPILSARCNALLNF